MNMDGNNKVWRIADYLVGLEILGLSAVIYDTMDHLSTTSANGSTESSICTFFKLIPPAIYMRPPDCHTR